MRPIQFFRYVTVALSVCVFAAGCAANPNPQSASLAGSTAAPAGAGSVASWESTALSVPDLAREASAIVRATVAQPPKTRAVTQELPMLDERGTPVRMVTDTMLFSDTLFDVAEVYSGVLPSQIYVMQTGGIGSDGLVSNALPDDPLYRVGEAYILFLVDISGDKVQAPDRELYRVVSPAGRFLIDGDAVRSFWADSAETGRLPQTLADLTTQISQAKP